MSLLLVRLGFQAPSCNQPWIKLAGYPYVRMSRGRAMELRGFAARLVPFLLAHRQETTRGEMPGKVGYQITRLYVPRYITRDLGTEALLKSLSSERESV